jgi:hypothetical protein
VLVREPEIWKMAAALMRRFGPRAPLYARERGNIAFHDGDHVAWKIWQSIGAALEELLRPAPENDEWVH